MKWFFRGVAVILLAFVAVCIAGSFLPVTQKVETVVEVDVPAEDIYAYISDLRTYPLWSGLAPPSGDWVFSGAQTGNGQIASWKDGERYGKLAIYQDTAGEIVGLRTEGPLGVQNVQLALNEVEIGTQFYISAERDSGGFPYLGRIAVWRQKAKTQVVLDTAALRLGALVSDGGAVRIVQ